MIRYFYTFLLSLISIQGIAQLCQGSLGDPIINISFGAGNNPGPPLSAAATGYQYVSSDCPNDGSYTVRNNTIACFGNSWHTITTDHTGGGAGYFMLVNASIQPSAFYVDTVKGLCGNSTYEFAAWVMNVILPSSCGGNTNQPNLTFTIENTTGTILQTYTSGNIPPEASPLWKQYGFFFTTPPAGSDIVLRIVNNAPGGCGNDLALDDITFRPCGPQLTPTIVGEPTTTSNICENTSKSFTFNCTVSGGFTNPVVQWQRRFNAGAWTDIPGETITSLTVNFVPPNITGNYEYRLTCAELGNQNSAQCKISSQPITIIVNGYPVATASNNGPVCTKDMLTLTATGGSQYAWTGPNGFSANTAVATIPNISATQAGLYNVIVTSAAGCSSPANTTVILNPSPVAAVSPSNTSICTGDSVQLTATGVGSYEWQPARGLSSSNIANPIASPDTSTQYYVIVSNQFGCRDTASAIVQVFSKAIANAGPDKTMIEGGWVILTGSIQGTYLDFSWTPPNFINDPKVLQPVVSPPVDAVYVLNVTSNNGCGSSTDTVLVKLYKDVFIPNAFTPNGDGLNDTWNIPALNAYPDFVLNVYDRYGGIVFHNSNVNQPWNGNFKNTALPIGAYVYMINLNAPGQPILKGTVTIIR